MRKTVSKLSWLTLSVGCWNEESRTVPRCCLRSDLATSGPRKHRVSAARPSTETLASQVYPYHKLRFSRPATRTSPHCVYVHAPKEPLPVRPSPSSATLMLFERGFPLLRDGWIPPPMLCYLCREVFPPFCQLFCYLMLRLLGDSVEE